MSECLGAYLGILSVVYILGGFIFVIVVSDEFLDKERWFPSYWRWWQYGLFFIIGGPALLLLAGGYFLFNEENRRESRVMFLIRKIFGPRQGGE